MSNSLLPNDEYISKEPAAQFVVDLIEGWTCSLPPAVGAVAGTLPLYLDDRATWAINLLSKGAKGKALSELDMDVLELGPLEGAHSYMLEQRGAKSVVAIEANKRLFLKCLLVKELMDLKRVRFRLGDFMPYLATTKDRYDLVWCTGVLYHMPDPLALLHAVSRVTDRIHIWTHYVDETALSQPWAAAITSVEERLFMGRPVKYYRRTYNDAATAKTYCDGVYNEASWITKDEIIRQLKSDGFEKIETSFDKPNTNGPSFALVAEKRR
ncbi:MAG: tRNA (mo5U34)-methyltransferase [Nitrospira sp.]|nr:tRNA (mo5U34)-methyltransferase [Nitrospira sp.]